jgi:iron complex outermembrane recepter protein
MNFSVFYLDFTNLLIPYQIEGSEEIFYANAGKAENKGFEFMAEFYPVKNLSSSIAYSGYDFRFTDYMVELENNQMIQLSGNYVPGVPKHKISAVINYHPVSGLFASMKLVWSDKYYTNDFNGPPPGSNLSTTEFINNSYINVGARLGYLLNSGIMNTEIFIGVDNLLNENYNGAITPNAIAFRYFEPSAERNWYAGIRIYFPGKSDGQLF